MSAKRKGGDTRSPAIRAKVAAQMASLAEHVANGGSICGWGRDNSVGEDRTFQLWRNIRNSLGEQAV